MIKTPTNRRRTGAIDTVIGSRIRAARHELSDMSAEGLARRLGITYQMVCKYERGINRVSAARLFEIAQIFDKPVMYFYGED